MNSDISRAVSTCNNFLDWLQKLANQAENHFWDTSLAEHTQLGAATGNPRGVADELCAGASSAAQMLLSEAALVCGVEFTVGEDSLLETRTLTPSAVASVVAAIKAILVRVQDLSSPPSAGTTHAPIHGAGAVIYEQIVGFLMQLGPKFASPITVLYPTAGITGISAEIKPGALTELVLTTTGGNIPAGAEWHQLVEDDIVIITKLDIAEFAAYVGAPLAVVAISGAELTLSIPAASALIADTASTSPATKPGDVFVIRKIRGSES